MQTSKSLSIKIRDAALSYPALFEVHAAVPGGVAKYGATAHLDINLEQHKETVLRINAGVKTITQDFFGGTKPTRELPLYKGWEKYPGKEQYQGIVIVRAYSTEKPKTVNAMREPVTDKSVFYPGCICHFNLGLYGWKQSGMTGLAFGLNGVQWIGDGTRLDSRKSVDEMFDEEASAALPDEHDSGFDQEAHQEGPGSLKEDMDWF